MTLNYKIAKSIFTYKSDGTLVWKVKPCKNIKLGAIVGTLTSHGYRQVVYKYSRYYVHRVIWLLHHRKFPKGMIDHKNGNPTDNRIENLRDCTRRENGSNRKIHRDGRQVGYTKHWNKYLAQIRINKRRIYLGLFKTEKEAAEKYQEALRGIK